MSTIRISTFLAIIFIIFSTTISLLACTTEIEKKLQQTYTSEIIEEKAERSMTHTNSTSMTITERPMATTTNTQNPTTSSTVTSQTASNNTVISIPTTTKAGKVFIPTVGAEISNWIMPYDYDKWTVRQFDYDVIHEQKNDYHFPWTLTVKNKTEADLDLTAYIIHWGYHHLIGYVSKTPFLLEAGEIKSFSGEDILDEVFYEEMIYLEDIQIAVYIVDE